MVMPRRAALLVRAGSDPYVPPQVVAAHIARTRAYTKNFVDWCDYYGRYGHIGEFGWCDDRHSAADAAEWNTLGADYLTLCAKFGLHFTYWAATSIWEADTHPYNHVSGTTWSSDTQAATLERFLGALADSKAAGGTRYTGINIATAEAGVGTSQGTTTPGTFHEHNLGSYGSGSNYYYYVDDPNTTRTYNQLGHHYGKGARFVRIPIRWERFQQTLGGALNATEVTRLKEMLDRCNTAGVNVLLDLHNYAAYWKDNGTNGTRQWIGDGTVTTAHFADLWDRLIAEVYNKPALFGVELSNEPVRMSATTNADPADAVKWEAAAQAAVSAIRTRETALGATPTWIFISGYNFSYARTWRTHHPDPFITDSANKLVYTAHHYPNSTNGDTFADDFATENTDALGDGYTATGGIGGASEDVVMRNYPAVYYQMNEAAGAATLTDISGHGRTGTVVSTVTCGQPGIAKKGGAGGKSLAFSGAGAITIGAGVGAVDFVTTNFTIGFLIQPTGAPGSYSRIFSKEEATRNSVSIIHNAAGTVNCSLYSGGSALGGVTSPVAIPQGRTTLVVVRFDFTPGELSLWIDGVKVATSNSAYVIPASTATGTIGQYAASGANKLTNDRLSHFFIATHAWDDAEITALARACGVMR